MNASADHEGLSWGYRLGAMLHYADVLLPHTRRVSERVLSLPTGTSVDRAIIARVCGIIRFAIAHGCGATQKVSINCYMVLSRAKQPVKQDIHTASPICRLKSSIGMSATSSKSLKPDSRKIIHGATGNWPTRMKS